MDSIQTVIHDYEEVEFYVSLDYHIGDTELYTCEGWGELYTELGIYDNQPTILDGDSDLDEDGLPDHHLWNSFAGETYSAYAFIDHHMVIRYLSYMPDFDLFTLELIPDLVSAMYGCMDSEADNFDASSVYDDGTCTYLGMSDSFVSLPAQAELLAAYPNPFNPNTEIKFKLVKPSEYIISIYDIKGKLVSILERGVKSAGTYSVDWNADQFPGGIYVANLAAGSQSHSIKLMLIK